MKTKHHLFKNLFSHVPTIQMAFYDIANSSQTTNLWPIWLSYTYVVYPSKFSSLLEFMHKCLSRKLQRINHNLLPSVQQYYSHFSFYTLFKNLR